jgi:hypothetical protein
VPIAKSDVFTLAIQLAAPSLAQSQLLATPNSQQNAVHVIMNACRAVVAAYETADRTP